MEIVKHLPITPTHLTGIPSVTITYDIPACTNLPVTVDMDALQELAFDKPLEAISALTPLLELYPNAPHLHHALIVAHLGVGNEELAMDLMEAFYRTFSEHLFVKVTYAYVCLEQNRLEEIPGIFNNSFTLNDLYPHEPSFWIQDVTAFYSTIGLYYCAINELDKANEIASYLGSLEIEEEDPYVLDFTTELRLKTAELLGISPEDMDNDDAVEGDCGTGDADCCCK